MIFHCHSPLQYLAVILKCCLKSVTDLSSKSDEFAARSKFRKRGSSLLGLFDKPLLAEELLSKIEELDILDSVTDYFRADRWNAGACADVLAGIENESAAVYRLIFAVRNTGIRILPRVDTLAVLVSAVVVRGPIEEALYVALIHLPEH